MAAQTPTTRTGIHGLNSESAALAVAPALTAEPPPGYWERAASHYPRPLSLMQRSFWLPIANAAARGVFDEFGLLVETIDTREIGGWIYTRLVPLGGKDRPAPPSWLVPLLIRLVPQMRSRIKCCVQAIRSDKAGRYVERWYHEWRPALIERSVKLRGVELTALTDRELDEHISALLDLLRESLSIHFLLHSTDAFLPYELARACSELLGWDDRHTLLLVSGLSVKSTEPARELAGLARLVRRDPEVRRLLQQSGEEAIAALAEMQGEFAAELARYLREFGGRALAY